MYTQSQRHMVKYVKAMYSLQSCKMGAHECHSVSSSWIHTSYCGTSVYLGILVISVSHLVFHKRRGTRCSASEALGDAGLRKYSTLIVFLNISFDKFSFVPMACASTLLAVQRIQLLPLSQMLGRAALLSPTSASCGSMRAGERRKHTCHWCEGIEVLVL